MDRNLNPELITAEVVLARTWFGHEYSQQSGGQVDFWEKLSASRKQLCREAVDEILKVQGNRERKG